MYATNHLRLVFAGLALAGLVSAQTSEEATPWTVLELDDPESRAALRDVDGDGDEDLVLVDKHGLRLRRMDANGRYPDYADLTLPWPSGQVAWNVSDLDGDGASEVLLYVDGKRILRYTPAEDAFDEATPVLDVPGDMPRGIFYMDFCRDIDSDGKLDLVLPAFGHYAIHLQSDTGFDAALEIAMQVDVSSDFGNPRRLGGEFGQDVEIPWFSLEDIDGDGRRDLRAETDEQVFFHLASPELPDEPTWVLDLDALEKELPPDPGVDLDDLLRMAGRQVHWRLVQLDPKRAKDLLVQIGSKFRIYHGGSRTGPEGNPDQLLKSSGNVLFFFLRDVTGDGQLDLQLLRGEGLSIGRVIRWLLFPGSLDFQLYTYTNEGGAFSIRPTRRNTISLKIPRILSFMERMKKMEEEKGEEKEALAKLIALDRDGPLNDIIDCREGKLFFYENSEVPAQAMELVELANGEHLTELLEHYLLSDLDRRGDGATRAIDFEEIDQWEFSAASALREASLKLEPSRVVPLEIKVAPTSLHVRDLNGDGIPDVIVIGTRKGRRRFVQFLVR